MEHHMGHCLYGLLLQNCYGCITWVLQCPREDVRDWAVHPAKGFGQSGLFEHGRDLKIRREHFDDSLWHISYFNEVMRPSLLFLISFPTGSLLLSLWLTSFRQHICPPCSQDNAIYRLLLMPADSVHACKFYMCDLETHLWLHQNK